MKIEEYIKELSNKDKKTLSQKALKLVEEVGELARAVLPYDSAHGTNHRFIDRETYRSNMANAKEFEAEVRSIERIISGKNDWSMLDGFRSFEYEKVEIEYAVYDTNVTHDAKWILGS